MNRPAIKFAVSVPDDLFKAVERARRRSKLSRSATVQDALRHWLRQQAQAELVREYEEGYRRRPESAREIEAAMRTAGPLLDGDDW